MDKVGFKSSPLCGEGDHPKDGGAVRRERSRCVWGAAPPPSPSATVPLPMEWRGSLAFGAFRLPPGPGRCVAEIAGAEEGVQFLRDAAQIGGHAARDAGGHVGLDRRDQPHRDRPEQPVAQGCTPRHKSTNVRTTSEARA